MTSYMIANEENICACCGLICLWPGIMPFMFDYVLPYNSCLTNAVDAGFLE